MCTAGYKAIHRDYLSGQFGLSLWLPYHAKCDDYVIVLPNVWLIVLIDVVIMNKNSDYDPCLWLLISFYYGYYMYRP